MENEVGRLRYALKLSDEQYGEEAKHSIKLEQALKEIIRVIDHEQPLGNGHRLREIARVALGQ